MPHPDQARLLWFDLVFARRLAWVSGLFSLVITSGLMWEGLSVRPMLTFDDPAFLAIKEQLVENPGDADLVARFRSEDVTRRSDYFTSRARLRFGAWMLLTGLAIWVLSVRRLVVLRLVDPIPIPPTVLENPPSQVNRSLVALLSIPLPITVAVLLAFLIYGPETTTLASQESVLTGPLPELPTSERWTGFRGNNTLGSSPALILPSTWNVESGENIVWKIPVPLAGNSSPIVWGSRVFLTGSDGASRSLFCFDLATGAQIWECKATTPAFIDEETKKKALNSDTGLAAPTPVTDGRLVYAFFGTNELIAVDFSGRQVWGKWLGKPKSFYGIATSPRVHEGKVILQLDQGDEEQPDSALIAFNAIDGNVLWKTPRPVPGSWSSPIIVDTSAGVQIVAAGNPWIIGYEPETGKELWRAALLKGDVAPLPVYANGRAFIGVQFSKLSAVRVDGKGDVTSTHVDWTYEGDLPDVPSPVTDGDRLLVPTSSGQLLCFRASNGNQLWSEQIEGEFWSSPTLVGSDVYLTNNEGITSIVELGDEFKLKGTGSVGERVITSLAVLESHLLIRGEKHLFLIGTGPWTAKLQEPI